MASLLVVVCLPLCIPRCLTLPVFSSRPVRADAAGTVVTLNPHADFVEVVVVQGVDSEESARALYPTVHGAGRVMSRTQAAGKWTVRSGEADEAPQVYRKLAQVLPHHSPTFALCHLLRPVGVAMAEPDEQDPYKD